MKKTVLLIAVTVITSCRAFPETSNIMPRVTVKADKIEQGAPGIVKSYDTTNDPGFRDTLSDLRERGPLGVQGDLSIRAGTFEQSVVQLNGVTVNDPQTGHFSMDIPVTKFDIDRVEIFYGGGGTPGNHAGIGGNVNFITRPRADTFGIKGDVMAGQNDLYSAGVSIDMPAGLLRNRFSFEGLRSGGYRPETDLDRVTAFLSSGFASGGMDFDFQAGYMKKDFGAYNFYSDAYENEEEHTDTRFMRAAVKYENSEICLTQTFYFRSHFDEFILDRDRPDWYRSQHKNYTYGMISGASVKTGAGEASFGADIRNESIFSTSLGKHFRQRAVFYAGDVLETERLIFRAFSTAENIPGLGWELAPEIGAAYLLTDDIRIRAQAVRALRIPSFTDLYYISPANRGNPALSPERAWTFDAGVDYSSGPNTMSLTPYVRFGENIIDWQRMPGSVVWQAENAGKVYFYGVESSFKTDLSEAGLGVLEYFSIKYSYAYAFKKDNVASKYVLNYLSHDLIAGTGFDLGFGIKGELNFSFKKRPGSRGYYLMDASLYRDMKIGRSNVRLFLNADNILNEEYVETGSVKQPGLWLKAGAQWTF